MTNYLGPNLHNWRILVKHHKNVIGNTRMIHSNHELLQKGSGRWKKESLKRDRMLRLVLIGLFWKYTNGVVRLKHSLRPDVFIHALRSPFFHQTYCHCGLHCSSPLCERSIVFSASGSDDGFNYCLLTTNSKCIRWDHAKTPSRWI